jgi:hypothetical protein
MLVIDPTITILIGGVSLRSEKRSHGTVPLVIHYEGLVIASGRTKRSKSAAVT